MTSLFIYLLKMIICSGILFMYYRLALRNKLFNQYNRFYLLGSVVLSLILPLVQFSVNTTDAKTTEILSLLTSVNGNAVYQLDPVVITQNEIGINEILFYAVALIGILLLLKFIVGLLQLTKMIRNAISHKIEEAILISTKDSRAPFSFFQYIFWRFDTAVDSADGKRIFLHELAHIKEKHSYDKLFMSLVLCVCWFNPFFWMMKRELYLIHEFIADRKAVKGEDEITALAAMLLAVYQPGEQFSITNNFFHSPIKRRLAMMTKNNKQKLSYASRLFALPLLAILSTAIAIQAGQTKPQNIQDGVSPLSNSKAIVNGELQPKDNATVENQSASMAQLSAETLLLETTAKVLVDSPPSTIQIYRVNGTVVEKRIVNALNMDEIQSIDIIKDAKKLESLGFKNYTSLIDIKLKEGGEGNQVNLHNEVVVQGYNIEDAKRKLLESQKEVVVQGYKIEAAKSKLVELQNRVVVQGYKIDDAKRKLEFSNSQQDVVVVNGQKINENVVFTKVEQQPAFPGGTEKWKNYLMKNLNPKVTDTDKLTKGYYTVVVKFIVKLDGTLSSFTAESFAGTSIAAEAIRVIQAGPAWNPAVQNGREVTAYMRQPITFVVTK